MRWERTRGSSGPTNAATLGELGADGLDGAGRGGGSGDDEVGGKESEEGSPNDGGEERVKAHVENVRRY